MGKTKKKKEEVEMGQRQGESDPDVALESWHIIIISVLLGLSGIPLSEFSFCGTPPVSWPVHMVTL
jgi:hypothetical protein